MYFANICNSETTAPPTLDTSAHAPSVSLSAAEDDTAGAVSAPSDDSQLAVTSAVTSAAPLDQGDRDQQMKLLRKTQIRALTPGKPADLNFKAESPYYKDTRELEITCPDCGLKLAKVQSTTQTDSR